MSSYLRARHFFYNHIICKYLYIRSIYTRDQFTLIRNQIHKTETIPQIAQFTGFLFPIREEPVTIREQSSSIREEIASIRKQ